LSGRDILARGYEFPGYVSTPAAYRHRPPLILQLPRGTSDDRFIAVHHDNRASH